VGGTEAPVRVGVAVARQDRADGISDGSHERADDRLPGGFLATSTRRAITGQRSELPGRRDLSGKANSTNTKPLANALLGGVGNLIAEPFSLPSLGASHP
jgi:hypothetical protein